MSGNIRIQPYRSITNNGIIIIDSGTSLTLEENSVNNGEINVFGLIYMDGADLKNIGTITVDGGRITIFDSDLMNEGILIIFGVIHMWHSGEISNGDASGVVVKNDSVYHGTVAWRLGHSLEGG